MSDISMCVFFSENRRLAFLVAAFHLLCFLLPSSFVHFAVMLASQQCCLFYLIYVVQSLLLVFIVSSVCWSSQSKVRRFILFLVFLFFLSFFCYIYFVATSCYVCLVAMILSYALFLHICIGCCFCLAWFWFWFWFFVVIR